MRTSKFLVLVAFFFAVLAPAYAESKSEMEEYELAERCGRQVFAHFKEKYGVGVMDNKDGHWTYDYSNHYNKKMNKCFFIITINHRPKDEKQYGSIFMRMLDFNENKQYGSIYVIGGDTRGCNVLEKLCRSKNEWNSLIAPYMNE